MRYLLAAMLIAGCAVPAATPLKTEHANAAQNAIEAIGLPAPNSITQDHDTIEIQFHTSGDVAAEDLAMRAVQAARNAVYGMPDADPDWRWSVSVWGPPPGPGTQGQYLGMAYFSTRVYEWQPA